MDTDKIVKDLIMITILAWAGTSILIFAVLAYFGYKIWTASSELLNAPINLTTGEYANLLLLMLLAIAAASGKFAFDKYRIYQLTYKSKLE